MAIATTRARFETAVDIEGLFVAFEQLVEPLGIACIDYAAGPVARWPMRDHMDWRPDVIRTSFDWDRLFFGTEFQRHDRMVPHLLRSVSPWLYWEVWEQPTDDPVTRELERLTQSRVQSGLSIPFHGPGLYFAGINLGSNLPREAFEAMDGEHRAQLLLLATEVHERALAIAGASRAPGPSLTTRELECLTWAASGKTAWETAVIMAISESAVKKHLGSAAARLGAHTRAHAVAVAVSQGLIAP